MRDIVKVGMADLKVAEAPDGLTTLGLGSCIGLTLYDPVAKIGGMVHYMLPDSTKIANSHTNIAKFGDTGIVELLEKMLENGASKRRMVAKMAGGACMFGVSSASTMASIGKRNEEIGLEILGMLNIPLVASDTGLNYGRTIILDCSNGELIIRAVGKDVKSI